MSGGSNLSERVGSGCNFLPPKQIKTCLVKIHPNPGHVAPLREKVLLMASQFFMRQWFPARFRFKQKWGGVAFYRCLFYNVAPSSKPHSMKNCLCAIFGFPVFLADLCCGVLQLLDLFSVNAVTQNKVLLCIVCFLYE